MGCTVAQIAEQLDAISEGSGANPGWPSQVFHHYLILPIFRFFDFLVGHGRWYTQPSLLLAILRKTI